ncbi:hypothetical protein AOC04_03520 [Pseudomonas versuta]|nr:hypothetical protein AOC04_03520 [Pseudomonas versuta]
MSASLWILESEFMVGLTSWPEGGSAGCVGTVGPVEEAARLVADTTQSTAAKDKVFIDELIMVASPDNGESYLILVCRRGRLVRCKRRAVAD